MKISEKKDFKEFLYKEVSLYILLLIPPIVCVIKLTGFNIFD